MLITRNTQEMEILHHQDLVLSKIFWIPLRGQNSGWILRIMWLYWIVFKIFFILFVKYKKIKTIFSLAFGGSKPRLINTLTPDTNTILSGFAGLTHDGNENNFGTGLRTAHLALKHRQSKNHRQRIVVFLCSPLKETEQELVKLAKKLGGILTNLTLKLCEKTYFY